MRNASRNLATSTALILGLFLFTSNADASDFGHHRLFSRVGLFHCVKSYLTELQVRHSSDNESAFQDPNTLEEKILNYAAVNEGLEQLARRSCVPSLHLTAGDHTLPGPFYQASEQVSFLGAAGLGDIAMYNAMGLDANGIGNHEFDGGIDDFATMLDAADYPFLAVNLDFSAVELDEGIPPIRIGHDGRWCGVNRGRVAKSCYTYAGGQKVGLIGRAPADFFNVVADPDNTLPGLDFVGGRDPDTNQPLVSAVGQVLEQVELLESRGVERIILLDHAQDFTGDPLAAQELRGIDIIISAGSTGFMAQSEANGPFSLLRAGDSPETDYPTVREDSEGNTVLVVNTDQQYRYEGNLRVRFDHRGRIVDVVDDVSGPVATTYEGLSALRHELGWRGRHVDAPRRVEGVFQSLKATPLIQNAFEVVGSTNHALNGVRAEVRTRETNLGRVAADSTLWYTLETFADADFAVDVALKNGGGIRESIAGPSIIRLTIQAALAFDNQLAVVELTGAQLLAAMENAVSRVPAADGRFPQVAGIELEYDASRPGIEAAESVMTPSRVRRLAVTRADGSTDVLVEDGAVGGDLSRTFVMATNGFLLTGGDGYVSLQAGTLLEETTIGEQQILAEYVTDALGGTVNVEDPTPAPRVIRLDTP